MKFILRAIIIYRAGRENKEGGGGGDKGKEKYDHGVGAVDGGNLFAWFMVSAALLGL